MDDIRSDTAEDPGRKESQLQLNKNSMSSKYLDEVIEKSGMEYNEAVETIEREKKARDAVADGTAAALVLDYNTGFDAEDWYARNTTTMPTRPKPAAKEGESFGKAREEDKERVKKQIEAGKRVSEADSAGEGGLKGVQKGVKTITKHL